MARAAAWAVIRFRGEAHRDDHHRALADLGREIEILALRLLPELGLAVVAEEQGPTGAKGLRGREAPARGVVQRERAKSCGDGCLGGVAVGELLEGFHGARGCVGADGGVFGLAGDSRYAAWVGRRPSFVFRLPPCFVSHLKTVALHLPVL